MCSACFSEQYNNSYHRSNFFFIYVRPLAQDNMFPSPLTNCCLLLFPNKAHFKDLTGLMTVICLNINMGVHKALCTRRHSETGRKRISDIDSFIFFSSQQLNNVLTNFELICRLLGVMTTSSTQLKCFTNS